MPNDGLDLPTPDPAPAADPAPAPAPAAPAPDITDQLRVALGPVAQAIRNAGERLERLEAGQQPQPAAQPKGGSEGGFWAQLAAADDPEALLGEIADQRVNKVLTEKLGPGLIRGQMATRDERLAVVEAQVDDKMGEGFFAKEIRPKLVTGDKNAPGTLEQFSIWEQSDPKVILATVKGALGARLWDQESDTLEKMAGAKKARAARTPANLVGSGMNIGRDPGRLTDDEREALSAMGAKGLKYDEKDYLADRKRGNSIDDWTDLAPAPKKGVRAGAGA